MHDHILSIGMTLNRLERLRAAGTSTWLDYITRTMLHDGELARRIREDALMGMTSNPTIFEKALAEGTSYDAELASAPAAHGPRELFELVATSDVRTACDLFMGVYQDTRGEDGYVSLEVSPDVANDAEGTVAEARRLWAVVDRPNLMIKVPGTEAGCVAVRRLIAAGINVNVTLLFAVEAHERVIEAYLGGLEDRLAAGEPVDHVSSVASFFVSRVDSEIDARLDRLAAAAEGPAKEGFLALRGKAAIANATLAYRLFTRKFSGPRWERLAAKGARYQRPLWASTSTKNPAYRDVIYVEELIAPHTVNTMPPATLEAYRDHGEVPGTIDVAGTAAEQVITALEASGIPMKDVTDKLLREGLASFQKSFDTLLAGLERKRAQVAA